MISYEPPKQEAYGVGDYIDGIGTVVDPDDGKMVAFMKNEGREVAKTYGRKMELVPESEWPFFPAWETIPVRVWQSKDYLAVLYVQRTDGMKRLTVNSVRRMRSKRPNKDTDWRDGITWDELQRVKNETLGPDVWCVEVYPAQDDVVDVANMRHLWPLDEPPVTRFPKEGVTKDSDIQAALDIIRKAVKR